jgi:AP-1-like factor
LKDLEQKVDDLEKASHSASHENSMLRAQIDRLQTELREYKRRLHTSEISKSSGLTGLGGFQFDFPPFGSGIFGSKDGKSSFGTDKAANNSNGNTRTPSLTNSVNGNSSTGSSKSSFAGAFLSSLMAKLIDDYFFRFH